MRAKEIEGPGTVKGRGAQNWFTCFKESGNSSEDKPRSGRHSVMKDKVLYIASRNQFFTKHHQLTPP